MEKIKFSETSPTATPSSGSDSGRGCTNPESARFYSGQRGRMFSLESRLDSPSDRVEKLLKKYRSRSSEHLSQLPPKQSAEVLNELEKWKTTNEELISGGYHAIEFAQTSIHNFSAFLFLSVTSSSSCRRAITHLLWDNKQKDKTIKDLKIKLAGVSPATPTPDVAELQSKIVQLEYNNTKLKIDLQNKPGVHELNVIQKKVHELKQELEDRISEQAKFIQYREEMKHISTLLSVPMGESMLSKIRKMKETLEQHAQLEQYFSSLVQLLYRYTAPKVPSRWERSWLPRPSGHDLWCEVTWNHMVMIVRDWSNYLQGMQDLEDVIGEVCRHLDQQLSPYPTPFQGKGSELESKELLFSCREMAELLKRWLLNQSSMKSSSFQLLLAMVRHFQHLFRIPQLQGVYPTMTSLSHQIETNKNIMNRIKDILDLGQNCSSHKLLSTLEYVGQGKNAQFLAKIHEHFGPMDVVVVIEKLKLCDEFFPSFHRVVLEIQKFLGVGSLSAILPALYKLQKN